MEVYLIRHTKPDIDRGICYGQSDIPLAQTFEEEWHAMKEKLPHMPQMLFSSPLSRCMKLSLKLSEHYGLPVVRDKRLMEMNFGVWEMKRWEEMDQDKLQHWMDHYTTAACPGGESYEDVVIRLKGFISALRQTQVQKVILVTH